MFMWDSPTISILSNPSFFVIFLDLKVACDAVHSQLQVHSPLASYGTTFSWVSSWFFLTYLLFSCSLTNLNNWSTLWPGVGLIFFLGDLTRSFGFQYHPKTEDSRFLFPIWFFLPASDSFMFQVNLTTHSNLQTKACILTCCLPKSVSTNSKASLYLN